jgi:hypothetical protein
MDRRDGFRCNLLRIVTLWFVVAGLGGSESTAQTTTTTLPPRNIIILGSDDYAWPYYGFMQRYLDARVGADLGSAYEDDRNFSPLSNRQQLLLPDDADASTPPLHRILTPALDFLASRGQFFPLAHQGASKCEPGMATALTGLHLKDLQRTSGGHGASPVLPEFLPGFAWSVPEPGEVQGHAVRLADNALTDPYFLTMGAGKWQWTNTHAHFLDDELKRPFDREKKDGTEGEKSRELMRYPTSPTAPLTPRLQDLKDFIDCSLCRLTCTENEDKVCTRGGNECGPGDGTCRTTPAGCAEPVTPPSGSFYDEPDPQEPPDALHPTFTRLTEWAKVCTAPRPFFMYFNPYIPHLLFETKTFCPVFERDGETCPPGATGQCCTPPWSTHSEYCKDLDPSPSANTSGLSCTKWANYLEQIGDNLGANDIYNGSVSCVPGACADPYSGNRFTSRGDYLRFINVYDRNVDELLVHLRERGLMSNTVLMYFTDNGFHLTASKQYFTEHGYRTPVILYDEALPTGDATLGRPEMAHVVDILATIRDVAGVAGNPPPSPGARPRPGEGGSVGSLAYEGQTLRSPISRPCPAGFDLPAGSNCLFGLRKQDQGITPQKGWYVLAEIPEGPRKHLCKFYRQCDAPARRVHDLVCDPNERTNLVNETYDPQNSCTFTQTPAWNPYYCAQANVRAALEKMLYCSVGKKCWLETASTAASCFDPPPTACPGGAPPAICPG